MLSLLIHLVEIAGFWRQSFYCLTVASISLLCMSYSFWGMFLIGLFRFIAIKFPIKSVLSLTSLKNNLNFIFPWKPYIYQ